MLLTLLLDSATGLAGETPARVEFGDRDRLIIGRSAAADWRLVDADRLISSLHCEIRRDGDAYVLADLSSNGTFVNAGAARIAAPHRLRDGDSLTLGRCVIRASLAEPAADGDATMVMRGGIETLRVAPTPPALRLVLTPETAAMQAGPSSIPLPPDRTLRIGRDPEADWTLSDTGGRISRIHCEIRCEDGVFRLHDASRNGTFLQGRPGRLAEPHPLQAGDRFVVGEFVVAVAAEPSPLLAAGAAAPRRGGDPAAMVVRAAAASGATAGDQPAPEATAVLAARSPPKPGPGPGAGPPAAARQDASGAMPMRSLAAGLGLSEAEIGQTDPAMFCEEVGSLLRLLVDEVARLLTERAEHEAAAGRTPREPLRAQGNNPLDTLPPEEAVRVMFGPPRRAYLDARRSFQVSFEKLRRHYAASDRLVPETARAVLDRLAPEAIAQIAPKPGAFGRLTHAGKAALWEQYVKQWTEAKASRPS